MMPFEFLRLEGSSGKTHRDGDYPDVVPVAVPEQRLQLAFKRVAADAVVFFPTVSMPTNAAGVLAAEPPAMSR
jgi:hypothetical protein